MMTDLAATAAMAQAALDLAAARRVTPPAARSGASRACPRSTPATTSRELLMRCRGPDLHDGDVLVVTSKIVSKAQGRLVPGTRDDHLAAETARVVARRGDTAIVETRHGFVMAAAGIDASNVPDGHGRAAADRSGRRGRRHPGHACDRAPESMSR